LNQNPKRGNLPPHLSHKAAPGNDLTSKKGETGFPVCPLVAESRSITKGGPLGGASNPRETGPGQTTKGPEENGFFRPGLWQK